MARNDGIDRTVARNQDLETPADVAKVQEHNEREKDSYSNQDIVPERTSLNVHFKAPTDDYVKTFEQMEQDGVISTRGLKPDAVKYGELVFDVNSAYFYNHGGYEFAKQFYADAYKAAVEIVGGEQYGVSGLNAALGALAEQGISMVYDEVHMVLAQGNFVLAVSEGTFGGAPTSYYDLWRVENGKIAEHWDVMETIADQSTWQNQNGKF